MMASSNDPTTAKVGCVERSENAASLTAGKLATEGERRTIVGGFLELC